MRPRSRRTAENGQARRRRGAGGCPARAPPGAPTPEAPLDPLLEADAPPLPGTGTRAFWIGLVVVSLSVVWALATFLILTNLTPDRAARGGRLRRPVRQPAAGDRHGGRHRGARRGAVARLGEEGRRRAPACAHRRPLQPDRGAAGPAAGHCRHHHLLARARQLVQPADHVDRAQLAQRRARLPGRARAGDPHRHRQHGQGPRRCGAARSPATRASSAS